MRKIFHGGVGAWGVSPPGENKITVLILRFEKSSYKATFVFLNIIHPLHFCIVSYTDIFRNYVAGGIW